MSDKTDKLGKELSKNATKITSVVRCYGTQKVVLFDEPL